MGQAKHDGLTVPGRVVLAHELPFRIADISVDPPTRQISRGDRHETLEPRVMQVLVALYLAGGIVTRTELVDRCWDGRVVGDDAINRVISRLRHVGADIGAGRFSVETIVKVGYRLSIDGQDPVREEAQSTLLAPVGKSRRTMIVALAAAGAAAAGIPIAWRYLGDARRPPAPARELYQRAIALRGSGSPSDNRQAIAYLKEAVRIAPEYGEAWGALALAYRGALLDGGGEHTDGIEERLQEAIRQADRYDPGNADAAFARRLTRLFFGRWSAMEPVYRDLATRFPDHPTGHYLLGSLLMDVGRWSEAVDELRKATATSAFAPIPRYKLTVSLWSAGRISEAEQEIDEALRWSRHGAIWQTKIKLLAMTGRPQAALAVVDDISVRPAGADEMQLRSWRLFLAAMASRASNDIDKAVANALELARQDPSPIPLAFQCAMLGKQVIALELMEGCYLGIGAWAAKRSPNPDGDASHPLFQPQARSLWGNPRFNRILEGIGLEKYWRETGTVPDYRRP